MIGSEVGFSSDASIAQTEIRIDLDNATAASESAIALDGDSFEVSRDGGSIGIRAGTERGLIHAGSNLLEKLGAKFSPGVEASYPEIEIARLAAIEPWSVTPAFKRRAFVSDIMTWNYNFPDRLELHLRHDREFIPWMARRGINAFSYIRHAHDTRLKIDEITPMLRGHGIGVEYGGHVLQQLLPRDRFADASGIFSSGRRRRARGARKPVRVESRGARSRARGRARLCARPSRDRAAAHLGRRRVARRVVPMRRNAASCRRNFSIWRSSTRLRLALALATRRRRRSLISPITTRSSRIPG